MDRVSICASRQQYVTEKMYLGAYLEQHELALCGDAGKA